jgi:hypothetical protein
MSINPWRPVNARDKSRNRDLQIAGWMLLPFTGPEIWRNPQRCADDVGMAAATAVTEVSPFVHPAMIPPSGVNSIPPSRWRFFNATAGLISIKWRHAEGDRVLCRFRMSLLW